MKTQEATIGHARKIVLDTIVGLANGTMEVGRGMAIAANMKVLNDSIQVEVNVAKMVIQAQQAGHDFGRMVGMGMRKIGHDGEGSDA